MAVNQIGTTRVCVRAGLVGAGQICEHHVAAIRRAGGIEIVGVFDLDPERARIIGERFGIPVRDSMRALRDAGADVIHVLTPPHVHAAVALEAIELGCHVLVEKPLAVDVRDCARIEEAAAEKGVRVCVNHSLLFDPQVRRALESVRAGKIGRVVSVDILRSSVYPPYAGGPLPPHYRGAGYPFRDIGVHALYLFQAFLGPVQKVDAAWSSMGGDPNLAYDEWRARVTCRDGMGQFQLSWNVKPLQSQMIVQGTKGVLRVDLFLMFQSLRKSGPLPKPVERIANAITDSVSPLVSVPVNVAKFIGRKLLPYHGLQDLVAEFYRSLETGSPVPVSAMEAAPVVEWTERVATDADRDHEEALARLPVSDSVDVLVTGANGGLGSAVVKRLLAEGRRVRVLVRRIPALIPEGMEVVVGNLGDPKAVDRAVRGAAAVIHAGAAMKGGWDEHLGSTVVGTRNVLDACVQHGVRKLVHVSSMSVVDWAGGAEGSPLSETSSLEPRAEERGAYTRAKLEAENDVRRSVAERGLPAVILRPGQIFGGKLRLLTPAVGRRLGSRWLVLGDGKVRLPLVFMDDVVDAIVLALDGPLEKGEIIQLVDSEELTQNDVLRLAGGANPKVVRVPRPAIFALGRFSEIALKPLKRKSPLSKYRLQSALAKRSFVCANAGLLGWSPRVGVCEGIQREIREMERESKGRDS